ncbi:uncharacterized protein LOC128679398 [Plodia interpunctella]|uniref:uncharacterized protein LOC128679398 n=1 Tax=Plodia interpunctella TaxID=58824 RepID=UPI002368E4AF|nr:uncharacterized protein LOC128679398 [Plodia interpunctella]
MYVTDDKWRTFWIEWTSDPVAQTTEVTVGRQGEPPFGRLKYEFLAVGEVDFQSTCHSEVQLISGLEVGPRFSNIGGYGLRRQNERTVEMEEILRTYTDNLTVTGLYKYYEAREEPIQIGVFLGKHVWREFFILLCSDYMKPEPNILIHIGEHYGEYCNIAKNRNVVIRVRCNLPWQRDNYLQFWIWHGNGKISIKSGYFEPDIYKPFMSWDDPEPFKVNLFALRTVIAEEIPMTVVDTEVQDWLIRE